MKEHREVPGLGGHIISDYAYGQYLGYCHGAKDETEKGCPYKWEADSCNILCRCGVCGVVIWKVSGIATSNYARTHEGFWNLIGALNNRERGNDGFEYNEASGGRYSGPRRQTDQCARMVEVG